MLDMLRKRIIVIDPQAGPFGFTTDRVRLHKYISTKILGCFFMCVEHFYQQWHCNDSGWTRSLYEEEILQGGPRSVSTVHGRTPGQRKTLATNHTGEHTSVRRTTAFELMRLQDNLSNTPAEALLNIFRSGLH